MGHERRRRLLKITLVFATCFAAGLTAAGTVAGASPLAAFSALASAADDSGSTTDTTATDTTDTDPTATATTSTEPTDTTPSDSTPTDTTPTATTGAASPSAPPTLVSDKPDYMPGETVTLTGANWMPGEVVRISVNDDKGQTWARTADVTAALDGTIRDQFQLPTSFVATYTASATGPVSGTATTTFTDGNVKWDTNTPADVTETVYTAASDCTGAVKNGYPKTLKSSDTVGVGNNESVRLDAEAVADNSSLFQAWSSPDPTPSPFTVISGTGGKSICVAGFQSGSRNYLATYAANTAPTANAVTTSTSEDTPKAITLSGSDAQQCELTFSFVSGPTNGSLGSISNDTCAAGSPNTDTASVTYTPNSNFNGSDSFTYRVNDGTLNSNSATVSITVTAVDDPPVAVNDSATVNEDSSANAINVLANDTDVDGGPKSVQAVTQPGNGSVAVTGGGAGVSYTPNANYCNGGSPTDNFTYTLNGGSTATVSVSVTCVDDLPVAVNDSATVNEDSGANAINVLANDTDPDGGPKTIQSVTQPGNGSVVITGSGSGLTYAPKANYCNSGSPTDNFTYTLNGGSTASVAVAVTCVDDPPVAVNDSATVNEDSGANAINVLANDTDVDGGPKSVQAVTQPGDGSVAVTGGGAGVSYTPNANYCNGGSPTDNFTYTLNGGSTGTVAVTVTCVNDPPVIAFTSGDTTADEGQTKTYAFSITDPDSTSFTYAAGYPSCGTGSIVGAPTLGSSSGSFVCSFPDDAPSITVAAKIRDASDPSNEITRNVAVANVPPAVTSPSDQTANEGSSKTFDLGSFSDPGADSPWQVTVDWGDGSPNTVFTEASPGAIADKPHTYADGPNTYTVSITVEEDDGAGASGAGNFKVTVANVPPEVSAPADQTADEGTSKSFSLGSFTDPGADSPWRVTVAWGDGSPNTVFTESSPGAIAAQTHTYADDGSYTVTVAVDEDSGAGVSDSATFKVTVANVPPAVTSPSDQTANEGSSKTFDLGSFSDPGADSPWQVTVDWGDGSPNTVFTEASPGAIADKPHTYADGPNTYTVSITVEEDDGAGASGTGNFKVTVANVPPEVALNGPTSANEGETKSYTFSFTDPGADSWSRVVSCGANGTASNSSFVPATKSGSFDCTFTDGPTSVVSVNVTDDDGGSGSASKTVTVSNLPPNLTITDPPYGQIYPVSSATVVFKGSFTDPGSGDTHTCTASWDDGTPDSPGVVTEPSGSSPGTCTATHTYTQPGVYTISMTVTDDDGGSDTEKWLVVVYDPSGGFVTGGGWIMSPAGAYVADPSLSGRANFGFVSKYKKGATVPEGQTEFQFQTGNLNFHSESYQWLVVAGKKAQYKGTGKINGSGGYDFTLTAWDESPDKFRIKITGPNGLVYDNKFNTACTDIDCADPQAIGSGSIVVHKG